MSLKVDIFGIRSVVVDNSDCDHFQGAQYPGNKAYNVPRAPPTPALNKEKRRQYGLCSQGDYSIDAGIYLPIQLCITISGFLFFSLCLPKLRAVPRPHSMGPLSGVDSRYIALNT